MRGQKKKRLLGNEYPRIHKYFQERGFEVQVIVHGKLVVFACFLKARPELHRSKMREVVRVRSGLFKPQPQHVLTGSERQYEEVSYVHVS
jgi:hypothetical protein